MHPVCRQQAVVGNDVCRKEQVEGRHWRAVQRRCASAGAGRPQQRMAQRWWASRQSSRRLHPTYLAGPASAGAALQVGSASAERSVSKHVQPAQVQVDACGSHVDRSAAVQCSSISQLGLPTPPGAAPPAPHLGPACRRPLSRWCRWAAAAPTAGQYGRSRHGRGDSQGTDCTDCTGCTDCAGCTECTDCTTLQLAMAEASTAAAAGGGQQTPPAAQTRTCSESSVCG